MDHLSFTNTSTLLIDSLKDPGNSHVWRQFVGRYRPVIVGFARSWGLTEADAEDVAQLTLADFSRDLAAGKYERGKGRLKSWMLGIARHRVQDAQRDAAKRRQCAGESMMIDAAEGERVTLAWNDAERQAIFVEALEVLRAQSEVTPETMRAFELAVLRGVPTSEVARECGMSENSVYVAKHRVTTRLREIAEQISAGYEDES